MGEHSYGRGRDSWFYIAVESSVLEHGIAWAFSFWVMERREGKEVFRKHSDIVSVLRSNQRITIYLVEA